MTTTPEPEPGISPAEAARLYLAGHQAPVSTLPPSRMMAEIEALRGLLGQVLNGRAAPADAPGPFEGEAQVQQLATVRAVYEAFRADPGQGKMQPHTHRLICEALTAAGVELARTTMPSSPGWLASSPPPPR